MEFHIKDQSDRKLVSTGSSFEKKAGYSRALVKGNWCFVAGTTGYDYAAMRMVEGGAAAQTRQTLATIKASLEAVGFDMKDIVRVNVIITKRENVEAVLGVLGEAFAEVLAPNTAIIADLLSEEMLVEVEVTAFREKEACC